MSHPVTAVAAAGRMEKGRRDKGRRRRVRTQTRSTMMGVLIGHRQREREEEKRVKRGEIWFVNPPPII